MSPSDAGDRPQVLAVATLTRIHGVRGELKLKARAEQLPLLREMAESAEPITLRDPRTGDEYEVTFASVRGADSAPIVKIDGVDDRTAAEAFRGVEVCIDRDLMPEPEEGEYYLADLDGCIAHAVDGGARIGQVVKAEALPANIVLTVRMDAGGKQVLVPFVNDAIPTMDIEARRIDVDLEFLGVDERGAEV